MHSKARHILALGSFALIVVACSSQSSGSADSGAPDTSVVDSPEEPGNVGTDAGSSDASADGGGEGGSDASADGGGEGGSDVHGDANADAAACPTIAEACADGGTIASQCVPAWTTAEQPSTWCPMFPYVRVIRATDCHGFDIVVLGATDTSSFYYYDPQSGALVGIEGHGILGTRCIAGQSPDVPLTECFDGGVPPVTAVCQPDGSVGD